MKSVYPFFFFLVALLFHREYLKDIDEINVAKWAAPEREKIRSCLINGLRVFRNAGGNSNGGVNEAWRCVGEEMEAAAEAHRLWGIALSEQLAKPLRVSLSKIIINASCRKRRKRLASLSIRAIVLT